MIKKEEVQRVAELARLELSGEEKKKMGKELSSILNYVKMIKEVDVSEVLPTFHPNQLENIMRKDEPFSLSPEKIEKLRNHFPSKEKKHAKVKEVFK